MPIYVYKCESCGREAEYFQSLSEAPKTECEACAGKLERVISSTAFHLKGGGWYKDLYSSPGGKSDGKSESKSEGKSESKSEGKSESKPEGKSESKSETPAAKPTKSE